TGFGPFYDGVTHVFATPQDLLPVVALALLGGLCGPRHGRTVLFVLPLAWLVGSGIGLVVAQHIPAPAVTAAVTIVLGVLVAADMPLPVTLVAGLAAVLGLLNGDLNGVELAKVPVNGGASLCLSVAGLACALFVVLSLLAGHVASLRAQWARVVV